MNQYGSTTIANGASESAPIDLDGYVLGAVLLPAAWTAADLTVLASDDGDTWLPVYDRAGNEYVIDADTSRWTLLPREATESFRHVKLRSGVVGAAVAQGAARVIRLAMMSVD